MNFTKEPPKVPGLYWIRLPNQVAEPVLVDCWDHVSFLGHPDKEPIQFLNPEFEWGERIWEP